jgi:hypothetical protein
MESYATVIISALEGKGQSLPPPRSWVHGWAHVEGDDYVFSEWLTESMWHFQEALDEHQGGPEHQECVAALHDHPVIKDRLGKPVGTALGATVLAPELVPGRLFSMMDRPEDFDEAFVRLYGWLLRERDAYVLVAPLPRLALEEGPVELEPSIELAVMTSNEMVAALTHGLIQGVGRSERISVSPDAALHVREAFPIRVGVQLEAAREDTEEIYERWNALIDDALLALQLYKPGPMPTLGAIYLSPDTESTYPLRQPSPRRQRRRDFELRADDAPPLQALWDSLQSSGTRNRTQLQTALRRFGFAAERSRPEDRIIDLMIAAEALFLPDEQTESAHKLALRGAAFLADSGNDPHEVFRHLKRAYGARSKLAHGGEAPKLKFADGTEATLAEYSQLVAGYLREVLRQFVAAAAKGNSAVGDWDELVLARLGNRN